MSFFKPLRTGTTTPFDASVDLESTGATQPSRQPKQPTCPPREVCEPRVVLVTRVVARRFKDPDTRKRVTGYVFTIAGGAVAWAARRQTIIAQSTAEVEYVAACETTMEGRGIVNMMDDALPKIDIQTEYTMGVDNNTAIALATPSSYSRKTRHIELRWYYVRDQVLKTLVKVSKAEGTETLPTCPPMNSRNAGWSSSGR
ncbi:hypothetical protein ON010_g15580 [Phytophthora cinnamomi]|nr:hypothetical protein ON010_g15580 [Phytophthora cinnamomi]